MAANPDDVRTVSDSSGGTDAPLVLPAPARRRGPLFTPSRFFNAAGWLVLALIVYFVVIPAVRYGNWEPFKDAKTWLFLWRGQGAGGLRVTLYVGVIACLVSTVIGFALALGRSSNGRVVNWLCTGYIELMRALPSYLIIFYVFIAVPKLGIKLEAPTFAIIGLTLYTSAVMAEIFRAGILSVEKGQLEAAFSLGLKPHHTILSIILPQAIRRMVPAIVSQLITLIKDTSLASIIALQELTRAGKQLYEFYSGQSILETLFVVAMIYFVICYALAFLSQRLEVKQGR